MTKNLLFALLAFSSIYCEKEKKVIQGPPGIPPPLPPGVEPDIPPPARVDPDFVSFARQESDQLEFIQQVNANDRLNTRFLTVCEQFNEGESRGLENYFQAVDKTLNSLSTERQVELARGAGVTECTRAFDMRDFGMTPKKWKSFENRLYELFGTTFESFTTRGILLKQLTQASIPSIPAHIFAFIALNQPVYSAMLELPATELELEIQLGVNLQQNFDQEDRDTYLFGKTQSPISLTKPRLGVATESNDGMYYKTYDILSANVGRAETNPFESPFPIEARSNRTLRHNGSEGIFSLPNGCIGYYLSDGDGLQADFAPLDLVADPGAAGRGLDPTIRYLSCHDCHSGAIIVVEDEIYDKIESDPSFNIVDRQKAQFWHGRPAGLRAKINSDNQSFFDCMAKIGRGSNEGDPINRYVDRLRQESSLAQVAALMSLKPEDFARKLRGTVQSIQEIGQLLNGDTVPLEQLQRTLPNFVIEANIFRDNFGE